jgi:hypothetical protein
MQIFSVCLYHRQNPLEPASASISGNVEIRTKNLPNTNIER